MTPKIYKDVNTKLFNMWGDYAGWAHSVRLHPVPAVVIHF